MPGHERATRVGGAAVVALGLGTGGALVAAAVIAVPEIHAQGWWAAGYWRLAAATLTAAFDRALAVALPAGAVVGIASALRRRRPAPRTVVRVALVLLGLGAGLRGAAAADLWRVRHGPNLVLVSIDTLRADRLGAYGCPLPTSPTIDARLAGEGVTVERVYSQSPKTTPSHMTMLTSLYPSVHGVELWEGGAGGNVLNPRVHTLAEVLRDAGYRTAAFTGGTNVHRSRGFDQGFEVYRHGDQLRRARRWLERVRGRKLFLFFHTFEVHDPYIPPPRLIDAFAPEYRGPVREAVERVRAGVGGWAQAHRIFWDSVDEQDPRDVAFVARLYDAGIRRMDGRTIGPLLDALERLGLADDTLVVLTSDHGEAFGEHGGFLHEDLHEETLRVPLILRFPGRLPRGARVDTRARLVDLVPTVLDLLGVPAPPEAQGESLTPLLRGAAVPDGGRPAVSEYSSRAIQRTYESVRHGALSYIVDRGVERLFDLARDPGEQVDVAAARPEALATMREELARWRLGCAPLARRVAPAGDTVAPDAETLRQLRALGYLE